MSKSNTLTLTANPFSTKENEWLVRFENKLLGTVTLVESNYKFRSTTAQLDNTQLNNLEGLVNNLRGAFENTDKVFSELGNYW